LAVVSAKKNAIKSTWTPGGLRKITWTPPESTWNMWGKVKSSIIQRIMGLLGRKMDRL